MRIAGTHELVSDRALVWRALQDAEVLVATVPGLQHLDVDGPGVFSGALRVGVGSVTGTYSGRCLFTDVQEGSSGTLRIEGSGSQGSLTATVRLSLSDSGSGGCVVDYDADAVVTGTVAAVGQRMMGAVGKRLTNQFLSAVDRRLQAAPAAEPASFATAPEEPAGASTVRRVLPHPPPPRARAFQLDGLSVLVGFVIALVALLVGRYV